MRTLVLCGDHWHPPRVAHEGLRALQSSGFVFDWIEDARDWSPEIMSSYRSVILTKSNDVSHTNQTEWMSDDAQAAFLKYVRSGKGLLAIHSGTAEYERKPVLRGLLGGVFTRHPDPCSVTINPRLEHPLCAESNPFTLQDEHYFMALDDPMADVFVTTTSVNGTQPGAWRRQVDLGRVAVLTPGHNLEVWLHPSFQALLTNSLRWCSKLM